METNYNSPTFSSFVTTCCYDTYLVFIRLILACSIIRPVVVRTVDSATIKLKNKSKIHVITLETLANKEKSHTTARISTESE